MRPEELANVTGIREEVLNEVKEEKKESLSVGSQGRRGDKPLKGLVPPTDYPGIVPEGEIELRKNNETGEVEIPGHVSPMQVERLAEVSEPEKRAYILEGLIPEGAATTLYGDGGVAKSLLAMSLCCSVSNGDGTWLGREIEHAATLFVDFELTADEQVRRMRSLCRGSGYEDVPQELYYLSALGHSSDEVFLSAYKAADDFDVGLMVVDSFGPAMHGEAESATDVLTFWRRRIEPFVKEGIAVLIIDHQAKGVDAYQRKTSFGSVYKRNLVRSQMQVEALHQDEGSGSLELLFRHTKHNFGPLNKPFGAVLGFRGDAGEIRVQTMELEPATMARQEHFTNEERVILAMSDMAAPISAAGIADETDLAVKSVGSALLKLERKGRVRRTGEVVGRSEVYELVDTENGPVSYLPIERDRRGGADF